MLKKTLLLSHLDLLKHEQEEHPENASRLKTILQRIQERPDLNQHLVLSIDRMASQEELLRANSLGYIQKINSLDGLETELDYETYLSPGSVRAAYLAAGLGLELIEQVLTKRISNGFALIRPPGHHARPEQGMGYCILNNIAIAAQHAIHLGTKRIVILDWDVHHGNGTQETFYEDDRILFIDLHQENLFPQHSGTTQEEGKNKGKGFTLNIPLPHSSKDEDYLFAFEKLIAPQIIKYQPELILVSAGFDAHEGDPQACMRMSSRGFRLLTEKTKALANTLCDGRLLLFLEGGYEPHALSSDVIECIEALLS